MKFLKVLYHFPNPNTIYAGKSIFYGYKHAFENLGYSFRSLTPNSDQNNLFTNYQPNIFFTSIGLLTFKYLNLHLIKQQKKKGMKVFVNIPFWRSPFSKYRINETPSISENIEWIRLIKSGDFGDVYYNICEQGDPKMVGFEKKTGYKHHTILLAADKITYYPNYSQKYACDISYIGTNLPGKVNFFKDYVFPLKKVYDLKIFGQDWSIFDKLLGLIQRTGQYFNLPIAKSLLNQPLSVEQERKIYSSSIISLNVHEDYQKKDLGDINERTFKIIASGGFEVVDNVPSLTKYFKDGLEICIAKTKSEWFDKIEYFLKNSKKRLSIIKAGRSKILKKHTYHNRVLDLIQIYKKL